MVCSFWVPSRNHVFCPSKHIYLSADLKTWGLTSTMGFTKEHLGIASKNPSDCCTSSCSKSFLRLDLGGNQWLPFSANPWGTPKKHTINKKKRLPNPGEVVYDLHINIVTQFLLVIFKARHPIHLHVFSSRWIGINLTAGANGWGINHDCLCTTWFNNLLKERTSFVVEMTTTKGSNCNSRPHLRWWREGRGGLWTCPQGRLFDLTLVDSSWDKEGETIDDWLVDENQTVFGWYNKVKLLVDAIIPERT